VESPSNQGDSYIQNELDFDGKDIQSSQQNCEGEKTTTITSKNTVKGTGVPLSSMKGTLVAITLKLTILLRIHLLLTH
jgi:hypothetical protein